MNFYYTKLTVKRYGLEDELEDVGLRPTDPIYDWGVKILYISGKKTLQVMHMKSRFSILMYNVSKQDMEHLKQLLAMYLESIFAHEPAFHSALNAYVDSFGDVVHGALVDKSAISVMNRVQTRFLNDGEWLEEFIYDGILLYDDLCIALNKRRYEKDTTSEGDPYFHPYDRFIELITDQFGKYTPEILH